MTLKEAADSMIAEIAERYGIKKRNARLVLIDALTANCVIEEIMEQVDFLMENHADEYAE